MGYDRFALKEKYPWLVSWETKDEQFEVEYGIDSKYDFGLWTDYMPRGWQISFAEQMVEDIALALEKDCISPQDYKICDVKEKFGGLRWYDNGGKNVNEVVDFYTSLSELTCCECGKPAEYFSLGWICPYCEDCAKKLGRMGQKFRAIT